LIEKHQLVGGLRSPERTVRDGKRSQISHGIRPSFEDAAANQKNPTGLGSRKGGKLFDFASEFTRNRSRIPFWRCPNVLTKKQKAKTD
jgi:hypothetical protein